VFRALSHGEYTNYRIHFPKNGELRITISREEVEQVYKDITAQLQGEDATNHPPIPLLLQQQTLMHCMGLERIPQFSRPKMDPYPTAPPHPGDPDYESYWDAYRKDWPDILPPKEELL
jgi:hypothetical protein